MAGGITRNAHCPQLLGSRTNDVTLMSRRMVRYDILFRRLDDPLDFKIAMTKRCRTGSYFFAFCNA